MNIGSRDVLFECLKKNPFVVLILDGDKFGVIVSIDGSVITMATKGLPLCGRYTSDGIFVSVILKDQVEFFNYKEIKNFYPLTTLSVDQPFIR